MIRVHFSGKKRWLQAITAVIFCVAVQSTAFASPFGQGVFGADVPFGSATSISVALGGNVGLTLTPSGQNFVGSGSHVLTVTSTDVVGYRAYVYSPTNANMYNGSEVINASGNSTLAALSLDTWGYNTDGSTNYKGMTTTPALLKDASGPYKNGDNTTVKYGVYVGPTKGAGNYAVNVVYTVVAKSQ